MAKLNLLIGNGESISENIGPKPVGPNNKKYPYSIDHARHKLEPQIRALIEALRGLPANATPGGEGVALITVHPAFLAKSLLPTKVFRATGLKTIGSRLVHITAEVDLRPKLQGTQQPTAELYISGSPDAFARFAAMLMESEVDIHQREFRRIESIEILGASKRIGYIDDLKPDLALEVALHRSLKDEDLLAAFEEYVQECHGQTRLDKSLSFRGLTFIPVLLPRSSLGKFALFSPLRTIRSQPRTKSHKPRESASKRGAKIATPSSAPISSTLRAAIFDGGLIDNSFADWVNENRACETVEEDYKSEEHGTLVTSAYLFGPITDKQTELPIPYTLVDHHKIMTVEDNTRWYELYEPLNRIKEVLKQTKYDFVNISLGPRVQIEDGHIDPWTTFVDEYAAQHDVLITVAAGNVDEDDLTQTRIQPPADAVNVLSVGSANSDDVLWNSYDMSCIGPGRSPGLVKPDGVGYAGTRTSPMNFYAGKGKLLGVGGGTSFAAPMVLRTAAGVRAAADQKLSGVALKALLIHYAERGELHSQLQVGWGRFPKEIEPILLSADNSATIIYQDEIASTHRVRARIPIPDGLSQGDVFIKATFCFISDIDPAHSINYTRSGLGVTFRPRADEQQTIPFFSSGKLFQSEYDERKDSHKWETSMSRTERFHALELNNPLFDIEYQSRYEGTAVPQKERKPLRYVLVVTVALGSNVAVYDQILNKYPTLKAIQLTQSIKLKT